MVGNATGYGGFRNTGEVVNMELLSPKQKRTYIKKLWEENPKKYAEWKNGVWNLGIFLIFLALKIIQ